MKTPQVDALKGMTPLGMVSGMNEQHRKELYELFQERGRTQAIGIFAKRYDYSYSVVMVELDGMINDAYSMACN